jgi:hypothetical protein
MSAQRERFKHLHPCCPRFHFVDVTEAQIQHPIETAPAGIEIGTIERPFQPCPKRRCFRCPNSSPHAGDGKRPPQGPTSLFCISNTAAENIMAIANIIEGNKSFSGTIVCHGQ